VAHGSRVGWKNARNVGRHFHQISKIDGRGPPSAARSPPARRKLTLTFPYHRFPYCWAPRWVSGGHLVVSASGGTALSLVASLFDRSWTARVHPNDGRRRGRLASSLPRSRRIASSPPHPSLFPLPSLDPSPRAPARIILSLDRKSADRRGGPSSFSSSSSSCFSSSSSSPLRFFLDLRQLTVHLFSSSPRTNARN